MVFPHSCRVQQRPDKYPRQFVLLNNYNIEIEYICQIGCSVIYLTTELHKVRHRYCNIDVTPCLIPHCDNDAVNVTFDR